MNGVDKLKGLHEQAEDLMLFTQQFHGMAHMRMDRRRQDIRNQFE
jgi:hypothetical protein